MSVFCESSRYVRDISFDSLKSYFRQLQEISDSVVEAELEGSLTDMVIEMKAAVDGLGVKINGLQSHQRYLDNLSGTNATGEEDDTCIVCRFVTVTPLHLLVFTLRL